MSSDQDVVVIGAGHNGLVTAFYLARAGRRPLVLERRPMVGGTAITGEFHPGFRCSTLTHLTGPVRREILADMALDRHGLEFLQSETALFAPAPDGRSFVLPADPQLAARAISAQARGDGERFLTYHETISRIAKSLDGLLTMIPPDIDRPSARDLIGLLATGRRIRGLGSEDLPENGLSTTSWTVYASVSGTGWSCPDVSSVTDLTA